MISNYCYHTVDWSKNDSTWISHIVTSIPMRSDKNPPYFNPPINTDLWENQINKISLRILCFNWGLNPNGILFWNSKNVRLNSIDPFFKRNFKFIPFFMVQTKINLEEVIRQSAIVMSILNKKLFGAPYVQAYILSDYSNEIFNSNEFVVCDWKSSHWSVDTICDK